MTCTCDVPIVAFGRRESTGLDTVTSEKASAGLVVAYAVACTTCKTAAQSIHSFEHAFMVLRNGLVKPPTIEAV